MSGTSTKPASLTPENAEPETSDPRDTDHPTGTEQAADNAADESPS